MRYIVLWQDNTLKILFWGKMGAKELIIAVLSLAPARQYLRTFDRRPIYSLIFCVDSDPAVKNFGLTLRMLLSSLEPFYHVCAVIKSKGIREKLKIIGLFLVRANGLDYKGKLSVVCHCSEHFCDQVRTSQGRFLKLFLLCVKITDR